MNGWPTLPLGDIAEVVGGSTPSRENEVFWNGNIPWVTPTDLPMPDQGISVVQQTRERITDAGLQNSSAVLVPKNSVLFSSRASIGKVALAGMPLTTNQGFATFIPRAGICPRFLAYTLWNQREDIARLSGSTTFKEVSRGTLRRYSIPVPPLSEQERIVKLLDEADALRKLRAEADRRTADLIPALFHDMFGDPELNSKNWLCGALQDFGASVRYGLGQPPALDPDGVPFLRATNIKKGLISETDLVHVRRDAVPASRHAFLEAGDVLVVRSGALTGDIALVDERWSGSVAGYDLVVSPGEQLTGQFVASFLLSKFIQQGYFKSLKLRAAQPHLNSAQVAAAPFFCPPLPLQKEFATRVAEIRAMEAAQSQSKKRLDDLFQSMLHGAFAGEL